MNGIAFMSTMVRTEKLHPRPVFEVSQKILSIASIPARPQPVLGPAGQPCYFPVMPSLTTARALVDSTTHRRWTAFVLLAALTACSDSGGEVEQRGGPLTTITVEVPNLRTWSVEYSVGCPDVQSKVGMTDVDQELETVAEGSLEPVGVGANGRVPPTTVWRVLIELPAASCVLDLETHDEDGALLCRVSERLKVDRRTATESYVFLSCDDQV